MTDQGGYIHIQQIELRAPAHSRRRLVVRGPSLFLNVRVLAACWAQVRCGQRTKALESAEIIAMGYEACAIHGS